LNEAIKVMGSDMGVRLLSEDNVNITIWTMIRV
jgi:hypothetical protein